MTFDERTGLHNKPSGRRRAGFGVSCWFSAGWHIVVRPECDDPARLHREDRESAAEVSACSARHAVGPYAPAAN